LKRDEIRDRLLDAEVLWHQNRKNGAFIQALVALAGLASLRYPKKTAPKVYFSKMREYHPSQATQITAQEKKQKSNRLSDGQRFKCMVLDLIEDIILPHPRRGVHPPKYNISLPLSTDRKTNIEDLFYKVLRCTAVHQGTFSSVAYLTERTPKGDPLVLTEPTGIPEWWIVHLVNAMSKTPELA
ncbi:MAG: hypothetical protein GY842_23015, partial [bacterium]|nr:hypothetical protein [bacterium]